MITTRAFRASDNMKMKTPAMLRSRDQSARYCKVPNRRISYKECEDHLNLHPKTRTFKAIRNIIDRRPRMLSHSRTLSRLLNTPSHASKNASAFPPIPRRLLTCVDAIWRDAAQVKPAMIG